MRGCFRVVSMKPLHAIIKNIHPLGNKVKEIERKYLLKDSITAFIKKQNLEHHKITQYYTTITPLKGIRYRKMDDRYFKTIKQGIGASREEEEIEVSQKTYRKKFKNALKKPVKKERCILHYEGREYTIDIFKKGLKGLYLLEVEFPDIESFETFELPKMLQKYVIKDVSFDEAYKNKNLVLKGRPDRLSKIERIFEELEKKSIDELEGYFPPNLSSIDALRVILYKYSLIILHYKKCILEHDDSEALHQFRVNIRKSRAFLKEFEYLFPENECHYFYENLSHFATVTNHKRDLDVIKTRLEEVDRDHDIIQEDIATQQKDEVQNIEEMLLSKHFENFFHTYQNILRKEALLTTYNTENMIEESARKVIRKLHRSIIKKIDALENEFNDKRLHKIRISFKKLRYLLEEFQHIFGEEKIAKMIEKGKNLQTLLGDYNDAVNQRTLLHNYFNAHKEDISHTNRLEKRLLKKTSKRQEELLQQIKKKLHRFKDKNYRL